MAKPDIDDDLDTLIDRAVDTFFVEAPSEEELSLQQETSVPYEPEPQKESSAPVTTETPTLDEAVDSLFMSSFSTPSAASSITSGDDETDRAIDLAVDTLFIEEPETPAPETTQVKVEESIEEDAFEDHLSSRGMARDHARKPAAQTGRVTPRRDTAEQDSIPYDDAMAKEIERHLHTLFAESQEPPAAAPASPAVQPPAPKPAQRKPAAPARAPVPEPAPVPVPEPAHTGSPLRKLQEAILTLEWEISKRSVTVLANEIRNVRIQFQDNVTVDFAALAMRVVLDYVVKRMSKAHPESIRFLLEVTDYLDRSVAASEEDPLKAFHHILMRYEKYKSVVRKAEGLRDKPSAGLGELEIRDPEAFAKIVEHHAKTLIRAGRALSRRLPKTNDPENLIRSFRFLVNRSISRVLERTHRESVQKKPSKSKRSRA
jgi:hypothetical protein